MTPAKFIQLLRKEVGTYKRFLETDILTKLMLVQRALGNLIIITLPHTKNI